MTTYPTNVLILIWTTMILLTVLIGFYIYSYSYSHPSMETFVTSSEKAQWKERSIMVFTYVLFRGFVLLEPGSTTIRSILDEPNGKTNFKNLLSLVLDRDGVLYFLENVWSSFVEWVTNFNYEKGPLTYTTIEQFVRDHPIFNGDKWNQTFLKLTPTLDSIGSIYLAEVQTERQLKQTIVPGNTLLAAQWKKRAHYLICALEKSTTLETFRNTLLQYGFEFKHILYTNNPYLYRRIYDAYRKYTGTTAKTYIENICFIYFQMERVFNQFISGSSDTDESFFKSLDALPEKCQQQLSNITVINNASGISTTTTTQTVSQEQPAIPNLIPIPSLRSVDKPVIKVPKLVPGLPADAVPFNPLDTKAEQKVFRWIMWVLIGISIMLWVVFIYVIYIQTPSEMELQPIVVPAPAPAPSNSF